MTRRYRLRRAYEVFFAADGDVYLLRGGAGAEHRIRRPSQPDGELLRALAHGPVGDDDRLGPLLAAGVVVPEPDLAALRAGDRERFDRQLPYLEDFGDPVALQRRLRDSTVAVLGCGGLGTWALGALACAGVGHFVLIDDDTVDLSNLNRQILYTHADLGAAKTARAAAWVRAFDPAIDVVCVDRRWRRGDDLGAAPDVLLLTADRPPYDLARWVDEAAHERGFPYIMAGQQPPLVKVGPAIVPGRGACYACAETAARRDHPLYDELAARRRREPPAATTLGPASALAGALLALEALHLLLTGEPPATHDRALAIDIRTLQQRWEAIPRDPDCARCGR